MLGFIIAVLAGFATRHIEEPLARPLAKALRPVVEVTEAEMRLLAFGVAMVGATVLGGFLHSGSPFWMVLGGVLGVFAQRLFESANKAFGRKG